MFSNLWKRGKGYHSVSQSGKSLSEQQKLLEEPESWEFVGFYDSPSCSKSGERSSHAAQSKDDALPRTEPPPKTPRCSPTKSSVRSKTQSPIDGPSPCSALGPLGTPPLPLPLIDLDALGPDWDSELSAMVAELRTELTTAEFNKAADEVFSYRDENTALEQVAADYGITPAACLDGLDEFPERVCLISNEDEERAELMRFYGADEDAVELKGKLKVVDGEVVETLFDAKEEFGDYEEAGSA